MGGIVDWWGSDVLIFWSKWYIEFMDLAEAVEEWSECKLCRGKIISDFVIYLVGVGKNIKGGEHIISDGLNWVEIEFFACGRFGKVFLVFAAVHEGVHEAYPTTFLEWFNNYFRV